MQDRLPLAVKSTIKVCLEQGLKQNSDCNISPNQALREDSQSDLSGWVCVEAEWGRRRPARNSKPLESPGKMRAAQSNLPHYVVAAIFAGLVIKPTGYMAIRFVLLPREPAYFFRSPSVTAAEFDRYMSIRN